MLDTIPFGIRATWKVLMLTGLNICDEADMHDSWKAKLLSASQTWKSL